MNRGEYRPLYVVLTDDPDFQRLSRDGKLLFFVLKLELGASGIGVVYEPVLVQKAGIPFEGVRDGLKDLRRGDWVRRQENVLWIRNGLRYEPNLSLANENHVKSVRRHLSGLPKLEIVNAFAAYYGLEPRPFPDLPDRIPSEGDPQGVLDGMADPENGERRTENGSGVHRTGGRENGGPPGDRLPAPADLPKDGGRYQYPEPFELAWEAYPDRAGGNPKLAAYRAWRARVAGGVDPAELLEGVERYRAHCEQEGKVGRKYVKQARTFFGPDGWWREEWDVDPGADPNRDLASRRARLEEWVRGGPGGD